MNSSEEWQAKLRRLGVSRGTRNLKPAPPRPSPGEPLPDPDRLSGDLFTLVPGGRIEAAGETACFVIDRVYPLHHVHANLPLAALLEQPGDATAVICGDPRLADLDLRDVLFLDTETTGLAGAGALAFMVGVAFFETGPQSDVLVVRQYFLRDHGDEAAMLLLLEELAGAKAALVTFNGRSFDVPLLDTRYLMNRMHGRVADMPHVDLLPPARRLWRTRLGSCALGDLEQNLLGLRRTHQDVPGWLIPSIYHNYLLTGDAGDIQRVFYHNHVDMLSMVTLATQILRQFGQPRPDDEPLDLLSLGRWQVQLGLADQAEAHLRLAIAGDLPLDAFHAALDQLAQLLKRNGRGGDAVPLWQQWAATTFEDVAPHVELAKHYEWHAGEPETALLWTERALKLAGSGGYGRVVRPELEHRRARLLRKLGRGD